MQENFCLVFSIASSVTKILANKIVSLYSIFFSKIVYPYRFKRYIFEYRCPTLLIRYLITRSSNDATYASTYSKFFGSLLHRARIFKLLMSPRIDSKESIPPAYVAWRAGTTTLFYSYSVPSPHRLLKIQAQYWKSPLSISLSF